MLRGQWELAGGWVGLTVAEISSASGRGTIAGVNVWGLVRIDEPMINANGTVSILR